MRDTSTTAIAESERERLGSIALDQWRGLALVFVLISHGFFFENHSNGIGRVGVNLFFFISGILVFRSLTHTRAATDLARAKSFWWRRLRRLYPAVAGYVLAMLAVVALLQHRPGLPPGSDLGSYIRGIPVAMLYGANYFTVPMSLGHLWSLSCEMQFYLLAPVIYLLGGRAERRRNSVFGFLLAGLVALGIAQPVIHHWKPAIDEWKYHFEFAVWPMMVGFCCEYKRHWFRRIPPAFITLILWLGAAVCAAELGVALFGVEMKPLAIATGGLLLAPCWLAYLFGRPMHKIVGPAMKWLGERTYSIYLWQEPFTICDFLPNFWQPAGALLSVVVGGAWFRWFERPFLSASRREAEKNSSSGRKSGWLKWLMPALVIFCAGAALAFWAARNRYENRLTQQIWPTTAPDISPRSNGPAGSTPTVLLLGDSRMAQWGLPRMPGWRVVNAGAGGLTTGQLRLCAPKLLDEFHPDTVVLEAGVNDLKYVGLRPETDSQMVSLVASNLAAVVHECAVRHCKVILLEVWPAGRPGLARRLVWSQAVPGSIAQVNARLRQLNAPAREVHVVDLLAAAGVKPESARYLDTLHFQPSVYRRLAPVLEKELDAFPPPAAK